MGSQIPWGGFVSLALMAWISSRGAGEEGSGCSLCDEEEAALCLASLP